LNPFEKCMLVKFLAKNGHKERATEIANGMQDKKLEPAQNSINQVFDIVLSMDSLNRESE